MLGDYDATKREAKAFLKEIVDQFPDPEEELIEIWETWFERMADGNHPVYYPDAARGAQILFRRGLRRVDRYLRLTTLEVPVGSKKDETHEALPPRLLKPPRLGARD